MINSDNITYTHPANDFLKLSNRLLNLANRKFIRIDFLREISDLLINFSDCDSLELLVKESKKWYLCLINKGYVDRFSFEVVHGSLTHLSKESNSIINVPEIKHICSRITSDEFDSGLNNFTKYGSYWTNDLKIDKKYSVDKINSLAVIPIRFDKENIGLLLLKDGKSNFFLEDEISLYEDVAKIIGTAINQQRIQVELRKRVKELTCLYNIAKVAAQQNLSLNVILQNIVELLPPGWLYPEIAQSRIIYGNKTFSTPGFKDLNSKLSADIIVNNQVCGRIELIYLEEKPEIDEGPFLHEERNLINAIARELGIIIEKRKAQKEKLMLQEQLKHADRLATIGQLAAGVAHELNEPLGSILGFAQLSKKCPGLPEMVESDLRKIENASLYAREVIRKLLVFARQTPSKKIFTNLNDVVKDCVDLLSVRMVKENIRFKPSLMPDLPDIQADRSQLNQVLVNLIVNSMQAMPEGGIMNISTSVSGDKALLIVEDSGVGIESEIINQIFLPFFTTKGENQGTGLGLAVVHGIITAHDGNIKVTSEVNKGTKFEISFPLGNRELH